MRISCTRQQSTCFYGVDTPHRSELIAATHSTGEIHEYLNAESIQLSQSGGLLHAVGNGSKSCCTSCYTGVYPVAFLETSRHALQLTLKHVDGRIRSSRDAEIREDPPPIQKRTRRSRLLSLPCSSSACQHSFLWTRRRSQPRSPR